MLNSKNFLYLNNDNYNNINSSNHRYINQNTTVNLNEINNERGYFSQTKTNDINNNRNSTANNIFKSSSLNNLLNNSNNISLNSDYIKKNLELSKNILDNLSDENFKYYSRILDFINEESFKLKNIYIILNKKKDFQTSLDFLNNNGEYLEYNQLISQEKTKYLNLLKEFNEKINEFNRIKNIIEKHFQYLIENNLNEEKIKENFEYLIDEINKYLIKFNNNNINNNSLINSNNNNDNNNNNNDNNNDNIYNNNIYNNNNNNIYNNNLDSNKLRIESINVQELQYLSSSKRQFYNNIETKKEDNNNLLTYSNDLNEEIQKKINENKKKEINSFYFLYEPQNFNKDFITNFTHSFFNNKKYKIICDYENLSKENPNVYSNRKNYINY